MASRVIGGLSVIIILTGGFISGCSVGPVDLMRDWLGPSRKTLAAKVFNMQADTDQRREAMVTMSERYWGLNSSALKGYALIAATDDEHVTLRCIAVRALGRAGKKAVGFTDEILVALNDKSADLRWDAAVTLDAVVSDAAIKPLQTHATADISPEVRVACVKALRHYRLPEVAATLVEKMDDPDYAVRRQGHLSLVEIVGRDLGPEATDWLAVTKKMPPLLPPKPGRPWWKLF